MKRMRDPTLARFRASRIDLLALLGLVLLLVGGLEGWPRPIKGVLAEGLGRGIALVAGAGLLQLAFRAEVSARVASLRSRDSGNGGDPAFQPDVFWLFDQQAEIAGFLPDKDPTLIYGLVELIVNPSRYRTRTVETVSLDQRRIKQRVSIEYTLPEGMSRSNSQFAYLPILPARKGELVDGFSISDASGMTLPDLAYNETVRLVSVALRLLIFACTNEKGPKLSDDASKAEAVLLRVIARRGVLDQSEVERDIRRGLGLIPSDGPPNPTDLDRLQKFARALGSAYPIITIVPLGGTLDERIILRYERTIISRPLARDLKDQIRLRLGLRPYQVVIPVDLALLTGSYHLQVEGPSDQYLMEQYLWCRACMRLLTRRWAGITDGPAVNESDNSRCFHQDSEIQQDYYYRLRRKWGQNYAHLYMRDYFRSRLRNIELLVRFGETPPGTLASAMVTAAAAAVLIGAIGRLISMGNTQTAGGIPALILAFPAIAASWFGFVGDTESVLRTSLAARLCLINTGLLSIVASAIYLLRVPNSAGSREFGLIGIHDPFWIALFVLASVNLFYVTSRYFVRTAFYDALLQRGDPDSGHGVR